MANDAALLTNPRREQVRARIEPVLKRLFDLTEVGPLAHCDVPSDVDVREMPVVLVRSGDQPAPVLQRLVGDDRMVRDTDRAERTGKGSELLSNLVGLSGTNVDRPGDILELLFLQGMIAPHQHEREGAVE